MNNFKDLMVDEDNYNYLVRKELPYYFVSYCYRIPRETLKGYLGSKTMASQIKIKNRDGAEQLFANYKEEFAAKFYRREITELRLNYTPAHFYYVTCPYCGKDAEIMDSMTLMGTDMEEHHPIICRHCSGHPEDRLTWPTVGSCFVTKPEELNKEKSLHIYLMYDTNNIKYKDFVANPNIIKQCKHPWR